MYTPTPWAHWRVARRHPFSVTTLNAEELVVAVADFGGTKMATCRLHFESGRITQSIPASDEMEPVGPYRLQLTTWGTTYSVLEAHPFILPHLFVTGVVDAAELRGHLLPKVGVEFDRSALAVTVPCELLRMVGRTRMGLRLGTSSNLERAI